jgi:hypothetical protein
VTAASWRRAGWNLIKPKGHREDAAAPFHDEDGHLVERASFRVSYESQDPSSPSRPTPGLPNPGHRVSKRVDPEVPLRPDVFFGAGNLARSISRRDLPRLAASLLYLNNYRVPPRQADAEILQHVKRQISKVDQKYDEAQ